MSHDHRGEHETLTLHTPASLTRGDYIPVADELPATAEILYYDTAEIHADAKPAPTIEPLGDSILLYREKADAVTKGGIVLPDSAQEKPLQCRVLAVGPGKRLPDGSHQSIGVKKDEVVLIKRYAGSEMHLVALGEDFLFCREEDLLARLNYPAE